LPADPALRGQVIGQQAAEHGDGLVGVFTMAVTVSLLRLEPLNILGRMDETGSPIPPPSGARRPVQTAALKRTLARLARANAAPWLHTEVAQRMAERLAVIKLRPKVILDWDARIGAGRAALATAYASGGARPKILAVDTEPARAPAGSATQPARPWWSPSHWRRPAPPPLAPERVVPGSAQLVWSNMALHACEDPSVTIAQWHRALAVDGFLMFSTLGPGSLIELRSLYADKSWGTPMAPLVDMHDLGDMLVNAGFADPVMDQEQIVLTWADPEAALTELRMLGANADPMRFAGLRTPRWRQRLLQGMKEVSRHRNDGRVALTFEVAYGHAFRPPARARVASEVRVDLADFQAMARERRR
jgi:malonyl-CoA O-methyltransferase